MFRCFIFTMLLLVGCDNPFQNSELSSITFELSNEVDENGYVHIITNPNVFQSLFRLSGQLQRDNNNVAMVKFGWYSQTYWLYDGFEVPIVNGSSYSNDDGEVNTMMGVLQSMVGDTITVYYSYYDDWKSEETNEAIDVIID